MHYKGANHSRIQLDDYSIRYITMLEPSSSHLQLQQALASAGNDADEFVRTIQRLKIPHLSFSKIFTVETCERRYVLQYIRGMQPDPIPESLLKGKAFHTMAASYYRNRDMLSNAGRLSEVALAEYNGLNAQHLTNVAHVFLEQTWNAYEVVGVEKAFVMQLQNGLPPLVGIIDLILKRDSCFVVVDHKTGRDFYQPDPLQMAIYKKYLTNEITESAEAEFYYDTYRWVQSNARARKPLFQRLQVPDEKLEWHSALQRIQAGYQRIMRLENGYIPKSGSICYMCPYRRFC